jgi:hypothetical protein
MVDCFQFLFRDLNIGSCELLSPQKTSTITKLQPNISHVKLVITIEPFQVWQ